MLYLSWNRVLVDDELMILFQECLGSTVRGLESSLSQKALDGCPSDSLTQDGQDQLKVFMPGAGSISKSL